jgi:hypothetical protein
MGMPMTLGMATMTLFHRNIILSFTLNVMGASIISTAYTTRSTWSRAHIVLRRVGDRSDMGHWEVWANPTRDDNGSGSGRVEQKPARDRTREM